MDKSEFCCPEWMQEGLMYQIFPDRFARSRAYSPPPQNKDYILREDWGGLPMRADPDGVVRNRDFFGGNLRGIMERLPYLQELGVTVIYLNPIFEAYSNHRYDTADYMKIDPLLGTEQDFRALCAEAGRCGIRIVLDGVFNHTGSDSVYFNKNGRFPGLGAYQSKDSPYYPWYHFIDYPDEYLSWWGISTLPGVNEEEPSYLDYIIRGEDSVVRHWLRAGASGFRLDVVDELPDLFLDELRKVVKEENPDAVIIGEVWEDASTKVSYGQKRRYLEGAQLDSVMNYPLKDAILAYFCGDGDATAFAAAVESLWRNYPETVFYGLMNILGTHDTPRILTVLSGGSDPPGSDRMWASRPMGGDGWYRRGGILAEAAGGDVGRQRLFAALLPWAFLPGIPCIYYGDEIGMEGENDPSNRRCFREETADRAVQAHYRKLLIFRKKLGLTRAWKFRPVLATGGLYLFVREKEEAGERLLVAVNGGGETESFDMELNAGETLADFFVSGDAAFEDPTALLLRETGEKASYRCRLGPCSGIALHISIV